MTQTEVLKRTRALMIRKKIPEKKNQRHHDEFLAVYASVPTASARLAAWSNKGATGLMALPMR